MVVVDKLRKYAHFILVKSTQVEPKGEFQVEPLCIMDKKETTLQNRVITQVKVQWKHFSPEEVTWELEEEM